MIGTSLLFSGSIAGLLGPGDIATPTAGYSLRPLSVSYSGAVVRVRRSGDDAEKDFNASGITDGQLSGFLNVFTESGHILNVYEHFKREFTESPLTFYNFEDVSLVCNCIEESSGLIAYDALANMVSHQVAVYTDIDYPTIDDPSLISPCNDGQADELNAFDDLLNLTTQNDGYVVTWYDQFGSNDATQTTAAEQPKIWDASTGLVTENGKPALDFDGVDDVLIKSGGVVGSSELSVFVKITIDDYRITGPAFHTIVSQGTHDTQDFGCYIADGSVESYSEVFISDSETTRFEYDSGVKDLGETILSFIGKNLFQQISKDGAVLATNNESGFNSGGTQDLFIGNDNDSRSFLGNMQEMIIYNSDQSANRTKIEDNINDYYNIY